MNCSTPGLPVHHQLPESTQTRVHRVGDAIQPSHLLSSPSPPALNLSQHQGLFQRVSSLHQVARVLEFQLQRQSFQRTPGLVSFRTDWLDFLAVQGILKSLLQHHSSKASILWRSAFFIVRVSHPYVTTGKTIALTRQTFVGKVMSLLFNTLSRLVITFLLYQSLCHSLKTNTIKMRSLVDWASVAQWWRIHLPMQGKWVWSLVLERSPGEGNSNPFQYSCLENPFDWGDLQAPVHKITKSWQD